MINGKTIAVVIPAYNEEKQIAKVIEAIPDFVDQIIVVNDGSTDETEKVSTSHGAFVINHNQNKGVGAAFNSGVMKVIKDNYDIMVNIDADGQFNPSDIKKLIKPIIDNKYDFVTASRFINPEYYPKMPKIKFWGNKQMSKIISSLTNIKFFDVSCGFRAYSKEALLRLNLFGNFTYTQETFIDLALKKISIKEIPIHVRGKREFGKSKVASNLFKYAYNTSKIIIKTYRDYKPLKLFARFALLFSIIGFGLMIFVIIHYLKTAGFTPYKWIGFSSILSFSIALVLLMTGFILDMFSRMRYNQEQLLYMMKKINQKD